MYWLLGIAILVIAFLIYSNTVNSITNNIASRYYALKTIFGEEDISEQEFLEMAGVFSQIVYVKKGQLRIDDIRSAARNAIKNQIKANPTSEDILAAFCYQMKSKIYFLNGMNFQDAPAKAIKELDKDELSIQKIKANGPSKIMFKSTLNYVRQFPGCLSGEYSPYY